MAETTTSASHLTTGAGTRTAASNNNRGHERPKFVKAMSLKLSRSSSAPPTPHDIETSSEYNNNNSFTRFSLAALDGIKNNSIMKREPKPRLSETEGTTSGDEHVQRRHLFRRSATETRTGNNHHHHLINSSKSFRNASKSFRLLLTPSDISSKSESVLDTPMTSIWDESNSSIMALARQMQADMNLNDEGFGARVFLQSKSSSSGSYFSQTDAMEWLLDKVSSVEAKSILDDKFQSQRSKSHNNIVDMKDDEEKAAVLGNYMLDAGCITTKCRHRFGIDEEDPMLRFDGSREPSSSVLYEFCDTILRAESILTEEHSLDDSNKGISRRNLSAKATGLLKDLSMRKISVPTKNKTPLHPSGGDEDVSQEESIEINHGLLCLVRQLQTDFQCLKTLKDRAWHLQWYKKTFILDDATDWIARQIQIQHGFWRMEQRSQKLTPDPVLTSDEAQSIAKCIGSAMVQHGYIFFCGLKKNDTGNNRTDSSRAQSSFDSSKTPPLKFGNERIFSDLQESDLSRLSEKEVDSLVNKLVHEEIQKTTTLGKNTKTLIEEE